MSEPLCEVHTRLFKADVEELKRRARAGDGIVRGWQPLLRALVRKALRQNKRIVR